MDKRKIVWRSVRPCPAWSRPELFLNGPQWHTRRTLWPGELAFSGDAVVFFAGTLDATAGGGLAVAAAVVSAASQLSPFEPPQRTHQPRRRLRQPRRRLQPRERKAIDAARPSSPSRAPEDTRGVGGRGFRDRDETGPPEPGLCRRARGKIPPAPFTIISNAPRGPLSLERQNLSCVRPLGKPGDGTLEDAERSGRVNRSRSRARWRVFCGSRSPEKDSHL
jgi:hypothetical protein